MAAWLRTLRRGVRAVRIGPPAYGQDAAPDRERALFGAAHIVSLLDEVGFDGTAILSL